MFRLEIELTWCAEESQSQRQGSVPKICAQKTFSQAFFLLVNGFRFRTKLTYYCWWYLLCFASLFFLLYSSSRSDSNRFKSSLVPFSSGQCRERVQKVSTA